DVTDTQVNVITLYPGRAPEEVEKQVTVPLEVVLSGLPNAVRMFSHTQFGLSFIIITFDDRANAYFARQQVVERLREVDLPDVAQATIGAVPRQGVVGQDDDDDIVTGIVLMRKGENPSQVLRAVKEKVESLNASVLPRGVQIVPFYDRTWLIDRTLTTVFTNL